MGKSIVCLCIVACAAAAVLQGHGIVLRSACCTIRQKRADNGGPPLQRPRGAPLPGAPRGNSHALHQLTTSNFQLTATTAPV